MKIHYTLILLLLGCSRLFAQDTTSQLEAMPQYPGGDDAFFMYLHTAIQYPDSAVDLNQEGTVIVLFEVDTNGAIINAKVVRGIKGAPYLDREALRVINAMPAWAPARQAGKPIKMSMSVPIRFLISVEVADQRKKELKEQKKADKKNGKEK